MKDDVTRGCQGKKRLMTMEYALKARDEMQARNPGEKFEAYKCWICKRWHVGHRPYHS